MSPFMCCSSRSGTLANSVCIVLPDKSKHVIYNEFSGKRKRTEVSLKGIDCA